MVIKTSLHPVFCGDSALGHLQSFILKQYSRSSVFILTDENVTPYCLGKLMRAVPVLRRANIIQIKSGEKNKNPDSCYTVWSWLIKWHADRQSLLVNLGGGMISDIGGFAASAYKRGIDYINIPTTLLAQVDAAIGGKTAVNFAGIKNAIGAFHLPKAVFIEPRFLATLNHEHVFSGFAEMLKHALIADKSYWEMLKKIPVEKLLENKKHLEDAITKSIRIKTKIAEKDVAEHNNRKLLNFGHTVGHAVEAYFGRGKYDSGLSHGKAIAAGMLCESFLSALKAGLPEKELNDITGTINKIFPRLTLPRKNYRKIIEWMYQDKKNKNGKINFTLLKKTGLAATDYFCTEEEIYRAFRFYREE